MGKVSPRDFDEMVGRLRSRAIALMRELDAGSSEYRTSIERELNARLAQAERAADEAPRSMARFVCARCGTSNDIDAAFCKRCGSKLPASSAKAAR
jgi:ribosomal protein L40E